MVHFFYTLPLMLPKKLMLATSPWRAAMPHAAQLRCTPCCGGCGVLPQAAIRRIPLKSRMCNAGISKKFPWGRSQPVFRVDNSRSLQDSMRGVFVRFGILASFFSFNFLVLLTVRRGCRIKTGCLGLRLGNKHQSKIVHSFAGESSVLYLRRKPNAATID